ncbi:RICIN domain-containing protein [Streptomyces sp. NPDC004111]|uniref:RICIN domain-containing protein n=1 Tax=Streptomyces sp. NPDC004111 TaxID=3364690 RepID=UPI00369FFE75
MSLWTSLEPPSVTVDPGSTTRAQLRVRNTGDVVDEYRFEPVGGLAPWIRVEPQTLRLYPGTTGTAEVTFSPPRTPDATAGPNPYAIRVTPTEHPDAVTVQEGNLTITPFSEVRAELVPLTVKGRFRGRPRLAVDNLGNVKLTASVSGSDNGDHLSYEIRPGNVQIEPGRAAFVDTTVKPRRITWFGSKEERPFTLALRRSGADPLETEGMYVQRGFLPRWLATFLGALVAVAIAFVAIWFAYKPQVITSATEQAAVGSVLPPSPSAQPKPPEQQPQPSVPAQPQPTAEKPGGGGDDKPKPKPTRKPGVVPAKNVLLQNVSTKLCADIPGADKGQINGPVLQEQCHERNDNQLWDLEVTLPKGGPGGKPLFLIKNTTDGFCMDLGEYDGRPIHTPIGEFHCDGTLKDNQLWYLDETDPGVYWIRNFASNGKCLDVAGNSDATPGLKLMIYECTRTDDQEWRIVPRKD